MKTFTILKPDTVKVGNAGAIMFCEVAAYAKSKNQTVDQLLDKIFATFGYFAEKNASLHFEGAEGAQKIERLLASYAQTPPTQIPQRLKSPALASSPR